MLKMVAAIKITILTHIGIEASSTITAFFSKTRARCKRAIMAKIIDAILEKGFIEY